MGIKTLLGRRRSENRIKRQTRRASRKPSDPEAELDAMIQPYVRSAQRVYSKVNITLSNPRRKAEGKAITKRLITHNIIGDTYRAVIGPRKPKRRQK